MSVVKAYNFDTCRRRLAFELFAGPSSGEWAWSRTMGQFPWQSDSGQTTGQWQKTIIYQYSRVGKLRASQRDKLYNRARMTEQIVQEASAAAHSDQSSKRSDRTRKTATNTVKDEPVQQEQPRNTGSGAGRRVQRGVFCLGCREPGRIKQNCPKKAEAPGRSQVASTGAMEATSNMKVDDLTEEQLEQMLADRRLRHKQSLLSGSTTNSVCDNIPAIGPTLLLDVSIEGLPIKTTVDTGAQSTIISRSTLHAIGRHLSQKGCSLPTLEKPAVRLYGKDGPGGGQQLTITAQL